MKREIFSCLFLIFLMACNSKGNKMAENKHSSNEDILQKNLQSVRTDKPTSQINKNKLAKDLYNAVYGDHVELVQKVLAENIDPNICRGESGWADSNPLNVVAEGFHNTYYRRRNGEIIPDPADDVKVLQLLLDAGADINRRPYIWNRVYIYNNKNFDQIKRQRRADNESIEFNDMKDQIDCFIADANRLLEAFLKAGADPDKLGHPYPFSVEAMRTRITDKQANEYFSKGTRAINEAIEKGILWESQIDLLLQYTTLDEESLRAAERSNDPAMVEKIKKLWEEQQREQKKKASIGNAKVSDCDMKARERRKQEKPFEMT
jgi:hypothetical protein